MSEDDGTQERGCIPRAQDENTSYWDGNLEFETLQVDLLTLEGY